MLIALAQDADVDHRTSTPLKLVNGTPAKAKVSLEFDEHQFRFLFAEIGEP